VIANGTSLQFTATGIYSDSTTQDITNQVTWSSDDLAVVTISNAASSEGLATSEGEGFAIIEATMIFGDAIIEVTAAEITSVDVTPINPVAADGTTLQFTATAIFSDASTQDVTDVASWSTDDGAIASIDVHGEATGEDPGATLVSASHLGTTGSTTLTVTQATLVSITVSPLTPSAARGTQVPFSANGAYTDGSTQDITNQVTWASDDTNIATVSNAAGTDGLADAVNVGTATIDATLGSVMGSTTLTVTAATLVSIAVTPVNPSLPDGLTVQFTATGTYTDSSEQDLTSQVTWASDRGSVARVSNVEGSEGLGTAVDPGVATISATLDRITGETDFTVTSAQLVSIAITPATSSIAKGFAEQLTATGTYTDGSEQDLTSSATWTSSEMTTAFVSNSAGSEGLTTALSEGTVTITASFDSVDATSSFTVTAATLVSIAITPERPVAAPLTTVQFTAMGTFSDSSSQDLTTQVSWTSSDPTVAIIFSVGSPQPGLATAAAPGNTTITATLSSVSVDTSMRVSSNP